MKKCLSKYLLLFFAFSCLYIHAQTGLCPRGDVNCDREVNIADINAVIDSILSGAKYHALYSYATDVNGDKEINLADINAVIDAIMGRALAPMPTYSGTLPVLFIETEGHRNVDSKEEYVHAAWWLDAMGIEGFESIGSPKAPEGLSIKGRGNYTWTTYDKKPYRLKLDEKESMLGMPANRHWVLMSNPDYWIGQYNDALSFEIGRRMGMAWNPRQEPIELVLNGQYIGLYFLTEKIRVGKERVNVIEQNDRETDTEKITGGWLLEIDNYYEPDHIEFIEGNGWVFWVSLHSPEVLSGAQRSYITDFFMQANNAIYTTNKTSTVWEKYIDIDSLAVYYIVSEIMDHPEAFHGSCFLHKQRGDNTKLIFGPLWDGGSSFSRYSSTYQFDEFIYENYPDGLHLRWIAEIVKFPNFQKCVRQHWKRFYNDIYPDIDQFLYDFGTKIEVAGNYNQIRWPDYETENIMDRINYTKKRCLKKKIAWLQSQWGQE